MSVVVETSGLISASGGSTVVFGDYDWNPTGVCKGHVEIALKKDGVQLAAISVPMSSLSANQVLLSLTPGTLGAGAGNGPTLLSWNIPDATPGISVETTLSGKMEVTIGEFGGPGGGASAGIGSVSGNGQVKITISSTMATGGGGG